jgi:hypothetical protein
VGRVCSTHGRGEESVQGFWWESPKETGHLEDQGVGGKWDQNGSWGDWLGGMDWILLAQDGDRWRAVVSAVMNLRVLAQQS